MSLGMKRIKKEYLRKILTASLSNRNYSTVIFHSSFCLDEIKDIIEELKDEFHIENVIFIDFDNDKVKSFYKSNPTDAEIERFIPKFQKPIGNTKIIHFHNEKTDFSDNYFSDYSRKYYCHLEEYNKEVFDRFKALPSDDITVTACPNKEWAESLLGSQERLQELWIRMSNTILTPDEARREIEERIARKNELNRMGIHKLCFYTDLGTDFRIALNSHSIWICQPNEVNGNFYNFPSYEIFTSPDCYSAEGKIIVTKKERFYYDITIENASLEFSKGRLISCKSNNETFDSIVLNKQNKMNRIGEIALVSQSSPLARTGEFYDSVLLDENAGCHFALGDYIEDCVGVDKEKIKKKGARYYHYNTSDYHTDLVFGDDSISVEAETGAKKKVLIMERGKWRI